MRMTISRTLNNRIELSILPPLYFSRVNEAFIFVGQGSLLIPAADYSISLAHDPLRYGNALLIALDDK